MRSHSTLVLCDACGAEVPDEAIKEVVYQVSKLRYRLELCHHCLHIEMKRHDGMRSIPGFRKRAAISFALASADDLPGRGSAA